MRELAEIRETTMGLWWVQPYQFKNCLILSGELSLSADPDETRGLRRTETTRRIYCRISGQECRQRCGKHLHDSRPRRAWQDRSLPMYSPYLVRLARR